MNAAPETDDDPAHAPAAPAICVTDSAALLDPETSAAAETTFVVVAAVEAVLDNVEETLRISPPMMSPASAVTDELPTTVALAARNAVGVEEEVDVPKIVEEAGRNREMAPEIVDAPETEVAATSSAVATANTDEVPAEVSETP